MPCRARSRCSSGGKLLTPPDAAEHATRLLGDASGQLSTRVAEEAAVVRVGSRRCDIGELKRERVVPARVPAAMIDDDRMRGGDRVEILPRQRTIELGVVEHVAADPEAGGRLGGFGAEIGLELGRRPDVGVDLEELVDAARMAMRVDEARHDRHLLPVDHLRAWPGQIADVVIRSDGKKASVLDREAVRARQCGIDRVDQRVGHDQIGFNARALRRSRSAARVLR